MHIASSIVSEQKEKEKRQLNIILHNLTESSKEDAGDRKSDDTKEVTSLFDKYLGIKTSISNAVRIG